MILCILLSGSVHSYVQQKGELHNYILVICGLGLIPVRSWDQNEGTDPLN